VSSYFLALIDIHDRERYDRYLAGFDAVFENFEGQVVSVEDNPLVLEGEWPARRTVLIRFPNEYELHRWYESPEYQRLARHRREASVASIAIISGRDQP
jgi:uncharacterized protein (DUF1330 family)